MINLKFIYKFKILLDLKLINIIDILFIFGTLNLNLFLYNLMMFYISNNFGPDKFIATAPNGAVIKIDKTDIAKIISPEATPLANVLHP